MAVILIIAGVPGPVYGQVTYTKKSHEPKLGPLAIQVKEKETVYVPTWPALELSRPVLSFS